MTESLHQQKNDQPHEEVPFSIGLRERNAWIDRDIDPDQQGGGGIIVVGRDG
jgi:hypothetical protein